MRPMDPDRLESHEQMCQTVELSKGQGEPKEPVRKPRRPTGKEKQDDSIMSTNSSCIVSKRCVEKIYDGRDQGFLRHFVKKFQRRSPLISRGYWLRMKSVQRTISRFLSAHPNQRTVIVNLGCGYDTLPFDILTDHLDLCHQTVFVDVDYPLLMTKKVKVILDTPPLRAILENVQTPAAGSTLLSSSKYMAVACDLENVSSLDSVLRSLGATDTAFLFVAEVSMTYMEQKAAEKVIEWASTFADSTFCLLEQFLPNGRNDPFAKTMLQHFEKLNSPLKTIDITGSGISQIKHRFSRFPAWQKVQAQTLWDLWRNDFITSAAVRQSLDRIEPFDEWEEFAMFASHYFVAIATTGPQNLLGDLDALDKWDRGKIWDSETPPHCVKYHALAVPTRRRFGAAALVSPELILHHGGHGERGRLEGNDIYTTKAEDVAQTSPTSQSVTCHTLTCIGGGRTIMVGGRTSPLYASSACFELNGKGSPSSTPAASLPFGLYRHSAVAVQVGEQQTGLLVYGGRKNAIDISDAWLVYVGNSWITARADGTEKAGPRFGATLLSKASSPPSGILMGGMGADGTVLQEIWEWQMETDTSGSTSSFSIKIRNVTGQASLDPQFEAFRFGASATTVRNKYVISGGVSDRGQLAYPNSIIHMDAGTFKVTRWRILEDDESSPFDLMPIGTSIVALPDKDQVLILGGGAVCFSFGAWWNSFSYILDFSDAAEKPATHWTALAPPPKPKPATAPPLPSTTLPLHTQQPATPPTPIPRQPLPSTPNHFSQIVAQARPVVLTNVPLGPCTHLWTLPYLRSQAPPDLNVTIHDSPTPTLSFLAKNFSYKTVPFPALLDAIEARQHVYMRALSHTNPSSAPANLETDWPWLAPDFTLPAPLAAAILPDNLHSSVLRLSGDVSMWLHYDVMANILCQIRGDKRLVLYPPFAVSDLQIPVGASSSRLSPFVPGAEPPAHLPSYSVTLKEGEVLFIPPLWAHVAAPAAATGGYSVAVNVFFRDAEAGGYAVGRDVYGNRDMAAYENARQAIQRLRTTMKDLSGDKRGFYLRRLAQELGDMAIEAETGP